MDSDMKFLVWFILIFVGLPMLGMAASEYQQYDCKVELAKAGRNTVDIKEICKWYESSCVTANELCTTGLVEYPLPKLENTKKTNV